MSHDAGRSKGINVRWWVKEYGLPLLLQLGAKIVDFVLVARAMYTVSRRAGTSKILAELRENTPRQVDQ